MDNMYCELGAIPLVYRRYIKIINYWARMHLRVHNRLSDKLFALTCKVRGYKWNRGVRKILRRYDMLDLWDSGPTGTLDSFKKRFSSFVWTHEQELLHERVNNVDGHSLWYKQLLPKLGKCTYASYMSIVNQKHLALLSQFRLRSNNLRIVTGAWLGEERITRYCLYCNHRAVDDEVHLLCECGMYETIRRKYLPEYLLNARSFNNCIKLMNSTEPIVLNRLCDFLSQAFKLRARNIPAGALPGAPPLS